MITSTLGKPIIRCCAKEWENAQGRRAHQYNQLFEVKRSTVVQNKPFDARKRRLRRISQTLPKQRKSAKNRFCDALRIRCTKKTRFFCSRIRLGVDFGCLGTLPGSPGRPFWRSGSPLATLRALPEGTGDAPGRSQDAPETSPRRP